MNDRGETGLHHRDTAPRASLLLIHDDGDLLDALTRIFEARGYEVAIAATEYAALSRLSSAREFHAIIAGWDAVQDMARAVYRWALQHRYELRDQFVFLALEAPLDFDEVVQGQCLLLHSYDFEEIVRTVEAAVGRALERGAAELPASAIDWVDASKPSLLLVDDDPLQLAIMKVLLREKGFAVTSAESCRAARSEMEHADFDVILCDWNLITCSGGDLYEWMAAHRSHLASRCVFMSGSLVAGDKRARGRPFVPKGQDSALLINHLMTIASQARARRSATSAAALSVPPAQPVVDSPGS